LWSENPSERKSSAKREAGCGEKSKKCRDHSVGKEMGSRTVVRQVKGETVEMANEFELRVSEEGAIWQLSAKGKTEKKNFWGKKKDEAHPI